MTQLTDVAVRKLASPEKGQKYYFDDALAGFACRVSQGGAKSFILIHGQDRRHITIGRFPIISLSQARAEAKRLLAEFTLGKVRPQSITFPAAVELFLRDKAQGKRPSTVQGYRTKLGRLGFKGQLQDFTHQEAARRIDRIKAPSERSHVLVTAKVFCNWAVNRRYITDNPFTGLTKPAAVPRTRVLSETEIRALWHATEPPGTFHSLIRLCLLTGQRRGELAQVQPDWIQGDILTIPSGVAKNHRTHTVPLTEWARQCLTFDRFNNWGDGKKRLDERCPFEPWVIHDIRRTVATRMAELGVAPHVIERLLNHITGTLSPIARVYNRATFLTEIRTALNLWESHLKKTIDLQ